MSTLVVGLGNRWRGDDAAGLEVARMLSSSGVRSVEYEGEPTGLLELWRDERDVVLVDTVVSGAPVGTVHRLDMAHERLAAGFRSSSSHHLGVGDAVELGRELGRLPERLQIIGIEGRDFDAGACPGAEVQAAAERLARVLAQTPP